VWVPADKANKLPILAVLRKTQYFMQTGALIAQTPAAITQFGTENCWFGWKIARSDKKHPSKPRWSASK
jgi:hypothetical protein